MLTAAKEVKKDKRSAKRLIAFATPLVVTAFVVFSGASSGHEIGKFEDLSGASHLVMITQGGLLYDNWYAHLGKSPPTETHPLISMLAFDTQDHVDILAYAQTLPMK